MLENLSRNKKLFATKFKSLLEVNYVNMPISFSPNIFEHSNYGVIHMPVVVCNLFTQVNYHSIFGQMRDLYRAHSKFWNITLLPCLQKVLAT